MVLPGRDLETQKVPGLFLKVPGVLAGPNCNGEIENAFSLKFFSYTSKIEIAKEEKKRNKLTSLHCTVKGYPKKVCTSSSNKPRKVKENFRAVTFVSFK